MAVGGGSEVNRVLSCATMGELERTGKPRGSSRVAPGTGTTRTPGTRTA